jgi:hypothetical protein
VCLDGHILRQRAVASPVREAEYPLSHRQPRRSIAEGGDHSGQLVARDRRRPVTAETDVAKRSAGVIRAGGTLVTIAGPTEARPADGRTVDFVVVPDRAQLSEIVRRARDGRVRTNIGTVAALDDAVAAFNPTERIKGKTIIRVRP